MVYEQKAWALRTKSGRWVNYQDDIVPTLSLRCLWRTKEEATYLRGHFDRIVRVKVRMEVADE